MRDTFNARLIKGNLGIYAEEPGTFKRDIRVIITNGARIYFKCDGMDGIYMGKTKYYQFYNYNSNGHKDYICSIKRSDISSMGMSNIVKGE